jgi:WD40 repeat protein
VTVDGPFTSAVFLPDGRLALATGEDGRLVVVDAGKGAEATTIEGVPIPEDDGAPWRLDPVLLRPSSVALAGEELLLGAADGTLRILDAATLQLRRTLEVEPQTLSSLRVIGDGTEAVTSGRLGTARIDLDTGRSVWSVPDPWRCTNLLVIEQAGLLFCGDLYGRLEERDLETGVVLRRLDAQNGNSGSLWSAAEGSELVSFGNNEPVVSRWRLDHSGPITRVVASGWRPWDFNHTGDLLLLEQGDVFDGTYRISLLDTTSGTILTTYDDLLIPSWAAADTLFGISLVASPIEYTRAEVGSDGHVGEHSAAGVVVQDPNLIQDFTIDTGKDQVLIRYQDDKDNNSLTQLDPRSLEYGPRIPVDGFANQAISRTGDRIVAGTSNGVVVFGGQTGERVGVLTDTDLRGVVLTVTDQLFVSSIGGELTLYDLETLEPIRTFGGSRGLATGGVGTADGSLVAIEGGDREVSLFDVGTGLRIGGPIAIPEAQFNQVSLSLDGRWLAVPGEPGPVEPGSHEGDPDTHIWDLDPTHWVSAACGIAGRNLTREEWATHIGDLSPYRPTCSQFPSDS